MRAKSKPAAAQGLRRLLVTHLSHDDNKGDLAILQGTVALLKDVDPSAQFDFHSVEALETEVSLRHSRRLNPASLTPALLPSTRRGGVRAIVRLGVSVPGLVTHRATYLLSPGFYRSIALSTHAVCKGGSWLFSRGTAKENLYLYRMLFPLVALRRARKPFVVLGVSAGPIESRPLRSLARWVLSGAEFVAPRETLSEQYLVDVIRLDRSKVIRIPDPAFYLNGVEPSAFQAARTAPVFGITARAWHEVNTPNSDRTFQEYMGALVHVAVAALRGGRLCALIAHSLEDLPVLREIEAKLQARGYGDRVFVVGEDLTPGQLRGVYQRLDFLIGTRLHSVILAATVGTPSVAIAYETHKVWGAARDLGIQEFVCDFNECARRLPSLVESIANNLDDIGAGVARRAATLRAKLSSFGETRLSSFLGTVGSLETGAGGPPI
jgi:polysaccharide pyruvyl transferase WcaK-like protein